MAVTTDTSEQLKGVLDLIRRIETGSVNFDPASPTPDTDKWIGDSVFVKDDADGIYKLSGSVPVSTINTESSGFWGLSAMAGDGRMTPGAYQVSLANIGGSATSGEDGKYFGVYGYSDKISEGAKREISFSKAVLQKYLNVTVDDNGIITSIGKEAASVFLNNPSLATSATWDATQNSLIGQYIDNFKEEQWSFYVGGRSQADITNGPSSSTDTREIPTNLAIMVDKMQTDFAGAFIFKDYTKVISNHTHPAYDYYKGQSYEDVVNTLFGATLNMKVIPGGTQAYGTTNTDFFQSKFNAGFITGYGYVGGFGGAFNLVNSLLMAKGTDQSEEGVLVPGGKTEIKDSNGNIIATYEMKVKMTSGNNTTETSDDVYEITNIPANLGGEYPTYAHYGALLSSTNLDSNPVNWADWKSVYTNLGLTVSDTNAISGFSLGYTQNQDITATNTAVGLVNYSSTDATVNVSGNKSSYVISPGTSSGGTTVNISNNVNDKWQASNYVDGNVYNFLPNDNAQITDIGILKNNSYVLGGGETKKLFDSQGKMITLDSSINYNLIIEKGGDGETTTSGAVYQIQGITSAQIKALFDSMNDTGTSNDKFTFVTPPVETANLIINASAAAGSVSIDANGKVKEVLLGKGNTAVNDNNTVATKYIINPNTATNSNVSISDLDVTVDVKGNLTINDTIDLLSLAGATISNKEIVSYNSKSDTSGSSTETYYDQYSYAVKLTISYGENKTMYLYLSFSSDKAINENNISSYIDNSENIILPEPDISKILPTSNTNAFNMKNSTGVTIDINKIDLTSKEETTDNTDPWFTTVPSDTVPTSGSYFKYGTQYLSVDSANIKNVDNTKFDYVLTKDSDAVKNPNLYHLTITTKSDVKMQYTNGVSNNFVSFTNSATIKDYKYEVSPTDSILTALLGTNGVNNKANIASIIHSLAVDNTTGIDLGKSKKYFVNDDATTTKDITLTTSSSKWKTTDNAYAINSYYKSNIDSYGTTGATYYKKQIDGSYEKNISYIDGGANGVNIDMSGSGNNYILALEDTISGSALSFETTKMFNSIKSFKLGNGNDIIDLSSTKYTINTDSNGNIKNDYVTVGTSGFNIKVDGASSSGNKVVFGGNGKNYIETGSGADVIFGGSVDDTLIGGTGNDVIFGGAGNDTLTGGAGIDTMSGGTGADIFIFNWGDSGTGTSADKITDFKTEDKIQINGAPDATFAFNDGTDILTITKGGTSMEINLTGIDNSITNTNIGSYVTIA